MGFFLVPLPLLSVEVFDGVDDAAGRAVMDRARQRIETIRKGDVIVHVTGPAGGRNGPVEIHLRRHAFLFGAAVTDTFQTKQKGIQASAAARATGLEVAAELFNVATVNCHWRSTQPEKEGAFNWAVSDKLMAWVKGHGLGPRMHCLIYMNEGCTPTWHDQVTSTDEWWQLVERRIQAVAGHYGQDYIEYDVLNETNFHAPWNQQHNPLFPSYDSPATGVRIFQIARKYLPHGRLLILDQFLPTAKPVNRGFDKYLEYCQQLIARGAPVDGIGYQGHFYTSSPTFAEGTERGGPDSFRMKELEKGLDRLAALGKPIYITEFNPPSRSTEIKNPNQARLSDEAIAAWSANFYTLAFSKPYIEEITRWFVVDVLGGRGIDAGLVTLDGKKKAEYFALKKLLKETWSTDWKGAAGTGSINLRGFYGEYEITAPGCKTVSFELKRDGPKEISVRFERSGG